MRTSVKPSIEDIALRQNVSSLGIPSRRGTSGIRRAAAAALALCALVVATACNDDGKDTTDPVQATPTGEAPAGPPAIINGNTFISTARKYRIDFPQDWAPDENFFFTGLFAIDAFFAPEESNGVAPSVQVRCEYAKEGGLTAEEFLAAKRQVAEAFAFQDVAEEATTLAEESAVQLRYVQQASPDVAVEKTELHLFSHGCGWTLTLTHAKGDEFGQIFRDMVSSFAFTGEGTP